MSRISVVLLRNALAVAVLWILPSGGFAQESDKVVEEISEEIGEDGLLTDLEGEELVSHLQRLKKHPVNINSASRAQLQATLLLTPFQIESILSRIESSGAILSFAELSLLYGFDEKTAEALRPYIVFGPAKRKPKGFVQDQSTSVYSRYQRSFGPAAETHMVRTRFSYLDRLDASVIYKGNSTASGSSSLSTASLSYSGIRLGKLQITRIVIGDFHARFGQGLSAWNGFSFAAASESTGYFRNAEPVSLYTSSDTSRLLRGAAVSLSWNGLEISGGYSFTNQVSLFRMTYTRKRVRAGLSFCGKQYEANVLSADLVGGGAGFIAFAEVACSVLPSGERTAGAFACLGGVSADIGKAKVHLLMRSYQDGFTTPLGGAYSSISRINNQQGLSLRMTMPVYRNVVLALGSDYTAYPKPRYHVKDPSCALRAYLKLSVDDSGFGTPARNQLWIKAYFKYDMKASVPREETSLLSVKAAGNLCLARHLSLGSRAEYNTLEGRALSASVKLQWKLLAFTCGAVAFHVPRWDGRIYFPQAELPYSFSSVLLYGRGMDAFALVKTRLSRRLSLYLKYQYNRGKSIVKGALSADF